MKDTFRCARSRSRRLRSATTCLARQWSPDQSIKQSERIALYVGGTLGGKLRAAGPYLPLLESSRRGEKASASASSARGLRRVYTTAGMKLTRRSAPGSKPNGRKPHLELPVDWEEIGWDDLRARPIAVDCASLSRYGAGERGRHIPIRCPRSSMISTWESTMHSAARDHVTNTAVQTRSCRPLGGELPLSPPQHATQRERRGLSKSPRLSIVRGLRRIRHRVDRRAALAVQCKRQPYVIPKIRQY